VVKLAAWLKNERKKVAMRRKLEQIHSKMYNSKFNFHKILPELTIEFFQIPLKEAELNMLRNEFSAPAEENCDDVCPVCFVNFEPGETLTRVPVCKHAYHIECLVPWLADHSTCPTCRSIVRAQMIEHYHGPFTLPDENLAGHEQQDNETDGTNPNVINIGNTGIEIPIVGDAIGRDNNTARGRDARVTNLTDVGADQHGIE